MKKFVTVLAIIALCFAIPFAVEAFSPETAMHYLKKAIEQHMPYGYYLIDEDYETRDDEFLQIEDDVYLLGTSTEQVRGSVAYWFEFSAFRLFAGKAIVFADGTVEFDSYVDNSSYGDYVYLFTKP